MAPPYAETTGGSTLFTDVVGSTEKAAAIGDAAWAELLEHHHAVVRAELVRFGGEEMDMSGDGFFAVFREPVGAVGAALAAVATFRPGSLTPIGTYLLKRQQKKASSWRLAAPRLAKEQGGELAFAADGSRLYLINDHSFFRLRALAQPVPLGPCRLSDVSRRHESNMCTSRTAGRAGSG